MGAHLGFKICERGSREPGRRKTPNPLPDRPDATTGGVRRTRSGVTLQTRKTVWIYNAFLQVTEASKWPCRSSISWKLAIPNCEPLRTGSFCAIPALLQPLKDAVTVFALHFDHSIAHGSAGTTTLFELFGEGLEFGGRQAEPAHGGHPCAFASLGGTAHSHDAVAAFRGCLATAARLGLETNRTQRTVLRRVGRGFARLARIHGAQREKRKSLVSDHAT